MRGYPTTPIRLSEWFRAKNHGLAAEARQDVYAAVDAWRRQNSLLGAPLSFEGPNGAELCARQYVGVVEINDVAIEIYPKLDATLLSASEQQPLSPSIRVNTVMQNLLWMLQVADYRDLAETETAHLEEAPTSFFDLFAYLLGKNLLPELERGVAHSYVPFEDDLKMVRGRINLSDQVTRNWNRFDQVDCRWDEFTPDTAINRLFKCACRFLRERVNYPEAARLLLDCQSLLSQVEDVSPSTALRDVGRLRFDRSVERFETAFNLAQRLLAGIGHNLGVGTANTYVFLLDMNDVFEKYVHAVLKAHFQTGIVQQKHVGNLLHIRPGGIRQLADFYWRDGGGLWIGDAKYKHLAKGQCKALRFSDFADEENQPAEVTVLAGRILDAADIRQLTVYAELSRQPRGHPASLILLYPFVGDTADCLADQTLTWNGSTFYLMPVQVKAQSHVGNAICFAAP